ncbi:MAG: hypothetical protein BWY31_01417 [Lentisphaerae bacterium ADurb.Bin242]|nr:MAG: hypothetical protein BWY31_01417 [Lentisphaerae bacterium ADurb.Bin242]
MKKRFTWILAIAAVFSAVSLFADKEKVLSAQSAASWAIPSGWQFDWTSGYLSARGAVNLCTNNSFKVYPDAEYELSGLFRTPGGQPDLTRFEFGFDPIDANGNPIPPESVSCVTGTDSILAAPVNIGDTAIRIRGNGTWHKNGHIAFQTNPSFSDLPNRNTAAYFNYGGTGEVMTLSLRNPMSRAYPAGTAVRNHNNQRLSIGSRLGKAPYEWTRFSARIKGVGLMGNINNQWWPGTAQAKVFIQVPGNAALDFKDVSVTRISE